MKPVIWHSPSCQTVSLHKKACVLLMFHSRLMCYRSHRHVQMPQSWRESWLLLKDSPSCCLCRVNPPLSEIIIKTLCLLRWSSQWEEWKDSREIALEVPLLLGGPGPISAGVLPALASRSHGFVGSTLSEQHDSWANKQGQWCSFKTTFLMKFLFSSH